MISTVNRSTRVYCCHKVITKGFSFIMALCAMLINASSCLLVLFTLKGKPANYGLTASNLYKNALGLQNFTKQFMDISSILSSASRCL